MVNKNKIMLTQKQSSFIRDQSQYKLIVKDRAGGSTTAIAIMIALLLANERNENMLVVTQSQQQHMFYMDIISAIDERVIFNRREGIMRNKKTGLEAQFIDYYTLARRSLGRNDKTVFLTDIPLIELANLRDLVIHENKNLIVELADDKSNFNYTVFEMKDNPYLDERYIKEYEKFEKMRMPKKDVKRYYYGDFDE